MPKEIEIASGHFIVAVGKWGGEIVVCVNDGKKELVEFADVLENKKGTLIFREDGDEEGI